MADDLTLLRDRIIDFGRKPADQFQAHPLNWRKHPQRQRDAVEASLRELGWVGVVIENVQTGNLIDGHERVWQALKAGGDVPYITVDLSPEEEALALATFDAITSMAETDAAKLDALLRDVNTNEAALQALMAETAAAVGLYPDRLDDSDAEPQIDRADELRRQWGVETGQLWRLPSRTPGQEHRLICGDCTDAAVVERVMGGELAGLYLTDPPYGVDYKGIENDDYAGLCSLLRGAFTTADLVLKPGAAYYICYPDIHAFEFTQEVRLRKWKQARPTTVLWIKYTPVLGRGDYNSQNESMLYGWKDGTHYFAGEVWSNVWQFPRPKVADIHTTEKPTGLFENAIKNSSLPSEIVLDSFLGSGTTLIAAENLARQCRAVEISPGYVAVALERYYQAFQIRGELVE